MMQDRTIIPVVPKSKALIHWCSWRITAANPKFQKGLSHLPNCTWLDWRKDVFMESWQFGGTVRFQSNSCWPVTCPAATAQISFNPKALMLNTVSKSTAASDSERHSAILNGHQCPLWTQTRYVAAAPEPCPCWVSSPVPTVPQTGGPRMPHPLSSHGRCWQAPWHANTSANLLKQSQVDIVWVHCSLRRKRKDHWLYNDLSWSHQTN